MPSRSAGRLCPWVRGAFERRMTPLASAASFSRKSQETAYRPASPSHDCILGSIRTSKASRRPFPMPSRSVTKPPPEVYPAGSLFRWCVAGSSGSGGVSQPPESASSLICEGRAMFSGPRPHAAFPSFLSLHDGLRILKDCLSIYHPHPHVRLVPLQTIRKIHLRRCDLRNGGSSAHSGAKHPGVERSSTQDE